MYSLTLYLLGSVVVACSTANKVSVKASNLPTPSIYAISDYTEKGPTIHWLLEDKSDADPVLGYKVKLWQVGCSKIAKFKVINGERVRLQNVMPRLRDTSTLRNLTEYTLEGVGNSSLLLRDIEPDVPYHMVVAAYGAAGEGPPSSPFRFQHRGRYTCREI